MAERVTPVVRVRAVRGRVTDPFRGTPADGDEDVERFASRAVDAQPIEDVVAILERIAGVKVVRAGRRFTLGRGHDVVRVAFASAARRVSLDDATFEGDGGLAIAALYALLPLFGAVELRVGDYRDLIDGHEPLAAVVERFDAWWIDESLKLAKRLAERDAAAKVAAADAAAREKAAAATKARRARRRLGIGFALVMAVLIVGFGAGIWKAQQKADVGERCTQNADCDSQQCLPREPVPPAAAWNGVELPASRPPPPADPSGVCTERCATDGDCPAAMRCGDIMRYGSLVPFGSRAKACVPRAWADPGK